MEGVHYLKGVTLLITHYNRSRSLERLLQAFADLNCSFEDIVVSDDCSKPEHIDYIEQLHSRFIFRLITTPKNGGLGNNINKGQDAVKTPYTLYVQEDFIPLAEFPVHFQNGFALMEENRDIDTVRFYSYLPYPNTKPNKYGFSEMIFRPWSSDLSRFPLYSDHPHLRRSNFLEKFGRYAEGKNPEKAEFDMMISFLQKKGKGLLFDQYKLVFDQINTSSEPSTMTGNRDKKSYRWSNNFFVSSAFYLYRFFLFNYSLYFKKY